jgi:hypothetical protein
MRKGISTLEKPLMCQKDRIRDLQHGAQRARNPRCPNPVVPNRSFCLTHLAEAIVRMQVKAK